MGSASCKNSKASEQQQPTQKKLPKDENRKITIGVFGLDNAGKTSAVKAIEGAPTGKVTPTMASNTSTVSNPTAKRGAKGEENIKMIDVSGKENGRIRLWSRYYDEIHGLIFVVDTSDKDRYDESKDILEELLESDKIRNKPILILANKKDQKSAVKSVNQIKENLGIEKLKAKHQIEICTALPDTHNKADESIRKGFSWLINTIEENYSELNARVLRTLDSRAPKPMERKAPISNKGKHESSAESDDDAHGNGYGSKRSDPPAWNRKTTDYRSPHDSNKLPALDLNKTKTKTSGHETYDEDDSDKEKTDRSRSRPNISRPNLDDRSRSRSKRSPENSDDDVRRPTPATAARSKLDESDRPRPFDPTSLLSTGGLHKKKKLIGAGNSYNDSSSKNEPKSFRAPYEQFSEVPPWSSSTGKSTKTDFDTSRSHTKPLSTNSSTNRHTSPLVHDTKPVTTGLTSKRSNLSDDEDNDRFIARLQPKSTTGSLNKPSSTSKKPTSGIYGASDDDEDDKKANNNYRRSPLSTSNTTAKKPFKHDDDDDDDDNTYKKKTTTKKYGSDDDDDDDKSTNRKSYQQSTERSDYHNAYRGTTSKPPSSPLTTLRQPKHDEDDFPSTSPYSSKPFDRNRMTSDKYPSTQTKPTTRFNRDDDDDEDLVSSSKPNTYNRFADDYKPSKQSPVRGKYDDEDRSSSPLKPISRLRNDDDYDSPLTSKPTTGSKYNNNSNSSSSLSKATTRPFHDNDDHLPSMSKSPSRTRYDNDDRPSSPMKPISRTQTKDDEYGSSSKSKIRPIHEDDDDDDRPSYSSKAPTRSRYDDDNRSSSPAKPTTSSKFEDDDDRPASSSRPFNRSKIDEDYTGNARSRYGTNDFNSAKGGSNSARATSASTDRFRNNNSDF